MSEEKKIKKIGFKTEETAQGAEIPEGSGEGHEGGGEGETTVAKRPLDKSDYAVILAAMEGYITNLMMVITSDSDRIPATIRAAALHSIDRAFDTHKNLAEASGYFSPEELAGYKKVLDRCQEIVDNVDQMKGEVDRKIPTEWN